MEARLRYLWNVKSDATRSSRFLSKLLPQSEQAAKVQSGSSVGTLDLDNN